MSEATAKFYHQSNPSAETEAVKGDLKGTPQIKVVSTGASCNGFAQCPSDFGPKN